MKASTVFAAIAAVTACFAAKDAFDPKINRCRIVNCTDRSTVGYKYFDFGRTIGRTGLRLVLNLSPEGIAGKMTVWAGDAFGAKGCEKVGELDLGALQGKEEREVSIAVGKLAEIKGRKALFFRFESDAKGRSLCSLCDFRFEAESVC